MKTIKMTALILGALLLTACSKVSLENYEKIKRGMPVAEVEAILGAPSSCDETLGVRNCLWGSEKSNISVTFAGDKVLNMGHVGIN